MKVKERTIQGYQGTTLFYRIYEPADSKAVVLAVHGHGDHSGGLKEVCDRLVAEGYAVCAFDLRGHGQSEGVRGGIRKWQEYLEDVHILRKLVEKEYEGMPVFIWSHSLGGVISFHYVLEYGEGLCGLVAVAPAISYETTTSEKFLITLMGRIKPQYTLDQKNDFQQLSRDKDKLAELEADELRHNTVTPGLGLGMMKTIKQLNNQASFIRTPVLMQYGTGDEITPPEKLRTFYEALGSPDKEKIEYEEARHRPFDDVDREKALDHMVNWLDKRLEKDV